VKNINDDFTQIRLNGLVSKQQSNFNKLNHENFSSLLNKEEPSDTKEEVVSSEGSHEEVMLQNQAYLNRAFLHLVA
jgi:hypothetical protein